MFPKHAAPAWAVVEDLNKQIKAAFAKPMRDADGNREIWRLRPEPAGPLAQDSLRLLVRQDPTRQALAARMGRLARLPVRRVAVTGDDVIAWLGVGPGPAVGAWLAQLRLHAAMGAIRNRRQARHWLSVQVRKEPVTGYNP